MFYGMYPHPATTTKCRHCGTEIYLDEAELCLRCGPICGDCLNGRCPREKQVTEHTEPTITSWDVDSGLGIGGISNDQSMPVIPSIESITRVQRLEDTDVVCRKCGASKNFDGATFTTGGGDVCDDCF